MLRYFAARFQASNRHTLRRRRGVSRDWTKVERLFFIFWFYSNKGFLLHRLYSSFCSFWFSDQLIRQELVIGSFLFFLVIFFISLNGRWLARDSTDKVNKPNDEWTSSWVSADNFWTRIKEFRHCVKRIQSIRRGSTWWEVQGLLCNQSRMSISFFHKGGEALISCSVYIRIDVRNVFQSHLDLSKLLENLLRNGKLPKKDSPIWRLIPFSHLI